MTVPAVLSALRPSRAVLALTACLAAATPNIASAWVSVANKAFTLNEGIRGTAAPASTPVHITVSLRLHNTDQMQAFARALHEPGNPAYGRYLAKGQFDALYGPTPEEAKAVSDYLATNGFTNIKVSDGRNLVMADGTSGAFQKAFNASLTNFAWRGKSYHINTTDVQVPDALGGIVQSVMGASNFPLMHLHRSVPLADYTVPFHRAGVATVVATKASPRSLSPQSASAVTPKAGAAVAHSGYSAAAFQTAYNATPVTTGHLTALAISTYSSDLSQVIHDLRLAEHINNLPVIPVRTVGAANYVAPATDDADADGEWALDTQSSSGIAQNLKELILYKSNDDTDANLVPSLQQFADDDAAKIGNMSYGTCEAVWLTLFGNFSDYETPFTKAVMQGQTWFASSGDNGSACFSPAGNGAPAGVEGASYPTSSPNIVSVGGTTLSTDANYNYVSETSWDAGGGGVSNFFAPPQWQIDSGAVPTALLPSAPPNPAAPGSTGSGRGEPDIAMSGDPASGFNTIVGGASATIGGTSLSSPLAAGAYARMQTAHCNGLGFAAPLFYKLDTTTGLMSTATGFNDVTSGTNGAYQTTKGWDYNTGFGSFNVAAVNAALPAASCAKDQDPVAKLSADVQSGPAPVTVTFNETGSSDPDNDGLPWYIIDFGDGSLPVIQTSPVFAPHSYVVPGIYVATATVRDGVGNVSAPVSLTITATGTPPGCVPPGQLLVTSPAGTSPIVPVSPPVAPPVSPPSADPGNGTDDLRYVWFAEPSNLTDQLVITMKVANLTTLQPNYLWITAFNVPNDANNYYVAMRTDATGAATFEYGTVGAFDAVAAGLLTYIKAGDLDASSKYSADGTIKLVLNKSTLKIKTGQTLTGIQSKVRIGAPNDPTGTGTLPSGAGETQDLADATGPYTVVGNDVCAKGITSPSTGTGTGGNAGAGSGSGSGGAGSGSGTTPVTTTTGGSKGRFGGGSFGPPLLLPLVFFGLRRRRRGH
jgi:PKD repeat protein